MNAICDECLKFDECMRKDDLIDKCQYFITEDDLKEMAKLKAQEDFRLALAKSDTLEKLVKELVSAENYLKIKANKGNDYDYFYALEIVDLLRKIVLDKLIESYGYESCGDLHLWEKQ